MTLSNKTCLWISSNESRKEQNLPTHVQSTQAVRHRVNKHPQLRCLLLRLPCTTRTRTALSVFFFGELICLLSDSRNPYLSFLLRVGNSRIGMLGFSCSILASIKRLFNCTALTEQSTSMRMRDPSNQCSASYTMRHTHPHRPNTRAILANARFRLCPTNISLKQRGKKVK